MISFPTPQEDISQADLERFRAVREHFRQDVREFWPRSNFYMVVQAGLMYAFVSRSEGSTCAEAVAAGYKVLPFVGALLAVIWLFVVITSLIWIKRWRDEVINVERDIGIGTSYARLEGLTSRKPWDSPEWFTLFVPILFGVAWVVLCDVA